MSEMIDFREKIRATDNIDLGVLLIQRVDADDNEALEAILQLVVRAEDAERKIAPARSVDAAPPSAGP